MLQVYAHEKDGHVIPDEPPSFLLKQTSRSNGDSFEQSTLQPLIWGRLVDLKMCVPPVCVSGVIHVSDAHNQRNTTSQLEQKSRQGSLYIYFF